LLEQIKQESELYRKAFHQQTQANRDEQILTRTRSLHRALIRWIQPQLPTNLAALTPTGLKGLQERLIADLKNATVWSTPKEMGTIGDGSVRGIVIKPEAQRLLTVRVGLDNGCGSNEALLLYDYSAGVPALVLEDHPRHPWGETVALETSGPLILTQRFGINCGSSWYLMRYTLYRTGQVPPAAARRIHEDSHSVWFGFSDIPLRTRLSERELRMDIRDRSIDSGIHSRPHVVRFAINGDMVSRLDPVALHPRDFVDEWINRPWTEMASRTESPGRLRPVHEQLHRDAKFAEFELLQHCSQIPSTWQIGLHGHFFLVRDLGEHRYRMVGISTTRQPGCPGQGNAIEVEIPAPK